MSIIQVWKNSKNMNKYAGERHTGPHISVLTNADTITQIGEFEDSKFANFMGTKVTIGQERKKNSAATEICVHWKGMDQSRARRNIEAIWMPHSDWKYLTFANLVDGIGR